MSNSINLAEAQLLGYFHAKQGFSLKSLIESMGLTKEEWKSMKDRHSLTYLSNSDVEEIDSYVENQ